MFECAALQMLMDDMPTLVQGVHSMRCFVWQDNMVLMSNLVRDAMRMLRAASSGDELDIQSARLVGDIIIYFFFLPHNHSM